MSIHQDQVGKLFKSVHPTETISKQAKEYVALLLDKLLLVLLEQCLALMHPKNIGGKPLPSQQNISTETVKTAICLCFPSTLQKYAIGEIRRARGTEALSTMTVKKRMETFLKCQIDDDVALALTVSLEYILAEVVELAGNFADGKRTQAQDVQMAIEGDEELKLLLQCIM